MEYIIISIILVIIAIVIKFALNIKINDIKKLKDLAFDKEKNAILNKLPDNEEIAKVILVKRKAVLKIAQATEAEIEALKVTG